MRKNVVMQTDFGLSDGAVSAMYGVAISVDPYLRIFDLTHEIPQFNIWEASYRLYQTIAYWPEKTVFISVVDPGVGSERLSIVVKTAGSHYIVTPDNGTLTHIQKNIGITEARMIDETVNRLPSSGDSYTFHGRDVYAYTGARLAAGIITFAEVGPCIREEDIIKLGRPDPYIDDGVIYGVVDILDVRFGNLWTNIDRFLFKQAGIAYGDTVEVTIMNNQQRVYKHSIKFARSFADSHLGEALLYVNSVDNMAMAINQGSFARAYEIGTGANWKICMRKVSGQII